MNRKITLTWQQVGKLFPIMLLIILCPVCSQEQVTMSAGPQYKRSSIHNFLWGKHYRKEWITPVTVQELLLDTVDGGLKPYKEGGSRQTKSLRLHNPDKKEYVMRSIDKSFGGALPGIFRHTFIESIINDQVTIGHPYSAVTIPLMSEAAGVYHTNPRIVYIPRQPALDSFSNEYGNKLYLLEQRPDENWEEADNFGNSKNIVGTEKLLEKIFKDNDNRVDQALYVRSRLFDMLIGDGSRHEDQWRWASYEEDGKTLYKPVPRDRDQAYARFDGVLLKLIIGMAGFSHLQTFGYDIPDVRTNNYPARNLDRRMANEPTLGQWIEQAKRIQSALTDEIIEQSVMQLPAEIIPVSAEEMIAKLKSRRGHLEEYAREYYLSLAKEVDVVGSQKKELFVVRRFEDGKTLVTVTKISKKGKTEDRPFYSRLFIPSETKEIRLYGLEGNDVYELSGRSRKGILIRIIGGKDRDSIIDQSLNRSGKRRTLIYDDHHNSISTSLTTKLHLSEDSSVHVYQYDGYKYNDRGLKPVASYSYEDKIYVGLAYKSLRYGWRKEPFRSKQQVQANYSLMQKKFSFIYKGRFQQFTGKWNLLVNGNYDLMRWTHFYGLGNETEDVVDTRNYYQMESRDAWASVELNHSLGKNGSFSAGPLYHMVHVLENDERFVAQYFSPSKKIFRAAHFGGLQGSVSFSHINDAIIPTKGVSLSASARYLVNLEKKDKHICRYDAGLNIYLPLVKNLILVVRPAAATVTGEPEFYQYVSIGGSNSLRGYIRERFWGNTSFYSANELRYLFKIRSLLFNGTAGLIGFYDAGRVWLDDEFSDQWHTGYGGGIFLAPFNKIALSVLYGLSEDGGHIHLMFSRNL